MTELEKAVERLWNGATTGVFPAADILLVLARLAALEREVKAWRACGHDETTHGYMDAFRAATDEWGMASFLAAFVAALMFCLLFIVLGWVLWTVAMGDDNAEP